MSASAQLKVELLLAAIDKVTSPLDAMKVASKKLTSELADTRRELKGLEGARLKINDLQHTNVALKQLNTELMASEARALRAQQALQNAEKPTTKLKVAARDAAKAHRELLDKQGELTAKQTRLSAALKESGINTGKLGKEEQALKVKISATTATIDKQTEALKRQGEMAKNVQRITQSHDKMMGHSQALKSAGTQAVVTGGVMAAALSQPIKAYAEAEDAATQLKVSMMGAGGQVAKEFEQVNALATNLGNRLPGSTADFQNMMTALQRNGISAQSVLAGVGESAAYLAVSLKMPTEEAAVFAAKMKGALKATDGEMLAVMDSIQKGFNLGVTPDAMLAGYSKLTPALGTLRMSGDAAAKSLAPLLVQATKMGMAGESAGNAFQKIIRLSVGAANNSKGMDAAKQYGVAPLKFTDDNGNFAGLQHLYKEAAKLKGLNDEARNEVLSAYFGNDPETLQAMSVIIDGGIEGYNEVQAKMQAQADLQTRVNEQLNTLANLWDAAKGTATNMLAAAGEAMGGDLKALANKMSEVSERTGAWMKQHPTMVKWIGRAVMSMIALSAAFGAVALAAGLLLSPFAKVWRAYQMFATFKAAGGLLRMASAFGTVGKAALTAGRFLLANPILLGAALIAGAAYLIYRNWDKVGPYFSVLWNKIKSAFVTGFHVLNGLFLRFKILNFIFPIVGAILFLIRSWHKLPPVVRSVWSSATKIVGDGIRSVKDTINNLAIVQLLKAKWASALVYFRTWKADLKQIGADIVTGLRDGIMSMWDSFASWFKGKIKSLITLSKESLDSHSPSRKFMQLGRDVMEGLGLGLNNKAHYAVTQTLQAMKRIKTAGQVDFGFKSHNMAFASGHPDTQPIRQASVRANQQRPPVKAGNDTYQFIIHGHPGMSAEDIARAVRSEIEAHKRSERNKAKSSYRDRD